MSDTLDRAIRMGEGDLKRCLGDLRSSLTEHLHRTQVALYNVECAIRDEPCVLSYVEHVTIEQIQKEHSNVDANVRILQTLKYLKRDEDEQ